MLATVSQSTVIFNLSKAFLKASRKANNWKQNKKL
jgi:hypothetical protein